MLGMPCIFDVLSPNMAGIRNFAFLFFLMYLFFLLSANLTVQKDEKSSLCKLSFSPLLNMISDINECEVITHNCSSNAVCNNTKGSYNCTCKLGYEGDGNNCTGNFFLNLVILYAFESIAMLFLFFRSKMILRFSA